MPVYEYLVTLFDEHCHKVWNFGVAGSTLVEAMAAAGIVLAGSTVTSAVHIELMRGKQLPSSP